MKSQTGKEAYSAIIEKSWNDPSYKQELIASPIEAIKRVTGITPAFPEGVKEVVVEDQTDENVIYVNIPREYGAAELENLDLELSEEELEVVAGGGPVSCTLLVLGAGAAFLAGRYL